MKHIRFLALLSALCSLIGHTSSGTARASSTDVALYWRAQMHLMKGDLTCEFGDPDCNRCVYNVREAFSAFSDSGGSNRSFDSDRKAYAPSNIDPDTVFTNTAIQGHFQSFARLPMDADPSDTQWFVASYSGSDNSHIESRDHNGFLLLSSRTPTGYWRGGQYVHTGFTDEKLRYIYNAGSYHPGGIQGIGSYFIVGHERDDDDERAYFEVYDTTSPGALRRTAKEHLPEKAYRTANVAVAKLRGGGYLLISNYSSLTGSYDYFYANDIEALGGFVYLGRNTGKYGNENISLVTECQTGELYVIGSTAHGGFVNGDNRWSLYRVASGTIPDLVHVTKSTKGKDPECNARAAGTATAGRYGKLNVFCHEKMIGDAEDGMTQDYREYATGEEELHWPSPEPEICSTHEKCCISAADGACLDCRPSGMACDGEAPEGGDVP